MRSSWFALCALGVATLFGCDGTPAQLPTFDVGVDAEAPEADAGPMADAQVSLRAHDAGILDFGAPGEELPDEAATEAADTFAGEVSFYARNLSTGSAWSRNADRPTRSGSLSGLFPVLMYANQVATGALAPSDVVTLTPALLRGNAGRIRPEHIGQAFELRQLAEYIVHNGDPTAETLLLSVIGGEQAVDALVQTLEIEGFGTYRSPCEHDALLLTELNVSFNLVECPALVTFAREADASGLPAEIFPEPPAFDRMQAEVAWQALEAAQINTGTARAWARLLTRLDDLTLFDARTSSVFRGILDLSIGTGGGADTLPSRVWSGSVQGKLDYGRHWLGLIRGGEAPAALVYLSWDHGGRQLDVGGLFRSLSALIYNSIVGPLDDGPATPAARPEWFVEALLVDESAELCDGDGTFDEALECRRQAVQDQYSQTAKTGGVVFLDRGPRADITWYWIEPEGRRHRYQTSLGADALWIWTRTLRVNQLGQWAMTIHVNGVPYFKQLFDVQ